MTREIPREVQRQEKLGENADLYSKSSLRVLQYYMPYIYTNCTVDESQIREAVKGPRSHPMLQP